MTSATPTTSTTASSAAFNPTQNKRKSRGGNKRFCGVCGDVASSNHFGGLCCNSCKAFFRRSFENDNHLRFYCTNKSRCVVSKPNRQNCRYCRMNRCLAIGMSKDWFWTEDQRKNLVETKKEKQKNQYDTKESLEIARQFLAKYGQCSTEILQTDFLTVLEMTQLESILTNYHQACPNIEDCGCCIQDSSSKSFNSISPFIKVCLSYLSKVNY